jgi:hypothetical protein
MAARFQGITDGARKVRGYKGKFMQAIKVSAEQQFQQVRVDYLNDADSLKATMKWFFNDLNAVKIDMTPLMPKKWRMAKTYANIYHLLMHDFSIGMVDNPKASSAHTLSIISFPENYYTMMSKIGFKQEDLVPHVIDHREAELVRDFRQLIIKFLDEWIDRIFEQERRDFASRNVEGSYLDQDEYGYLRTKNLVALWRMLREQVEVAINSQRADVVEGVVDAMFLRLRTRQQSWQRMLDDEAERYESGRILDLEGFQALQDWLVAVANDQIGVIDDNEEENRLGYLSSFRQQFERNVSPQYLECTEQEFNAICDGYVDLSTWCIHNCLPRLRRRLQGRHARLLHIHVVHQHGHEADDCHL